MAKVKEVEKAVESIALPLAAEQGVELWDVRFVKEGSEFYLRITLDKDGGIGITDCENFSRAIDPLLDEADPIDVAYYLEVSSPGLGRPLTRDKHFLASVGKEICVKLYSAKEGKKEAVGILTDYRDGAVTISENGADTTYLKNEISAVKLNDDADLF